MEPAQSDMYPWNADEPSEPDPSEQTRAILQDLIFETQSAIRALDRLTGLCLAQREAELAEAGIHPGDPGYVEAVMEEFWPQFHVLAAMQQACQILERASA